MMKIAVVTDTKSELSDFVCSELNRDFEICVLLTQASQIEVAYRRHLKSLVRVLRNPALFFFKFLSAAQRFARGDRQPHVSLKSAARFHLKRHDFIDQNPDRSVPKVLFRSEQDIVKEVLIRKPAAVIFLGGAIYSKKFLDDMPLALGIHTGISPIYNGSNSQYWAFVNRQPFLCGATLLQMNEKVDGGGILGHFAVGIDRSDGPADLFCKSLMGGTSLCRQFLEFYHNNRTFRTIVQSKPLFLNKSSDWTVCHSLKLFRLLRQEICKADVRSSEQVSYWDAANDSEARQRFHSNILKWLRIDEV